ncbi:MAG TPA: universal stress protein [Flavobacteriales bacterium]|nr:universal stress protein [Flavobacteriales bacterium]
MAHILIPTDFSDGSLNACAYALDLYGGALNTYTLLHSYMDPLPGYAAMVDMTSALYASSVEGLAEFTTRFRALRNGADALVTTEVVYGPLATALPGVCKQRDIDIIVMGTQGATVGGTLFGSNAADVAKTSKIPVLIVPKDAKFAGLRHILLADDHVRVEPFAMRLLVTLANEHGADITIAHVLRNPAEEPDPQVLADYDEIFLRVPHTYADAPGGDVAQALAQTADRDAMDLVAVLHRHTGFLDGLFHGSVAKRLALQTRIPLLVLEH